MDAICRYFGELETKLASLEGDGETDDKVLSRCRMLIKLAATEVNADRSVARTANKKSLKTYKARLADAERRALLGNRSRNEGAHHNVLSQEKRAQRSAAQLRDAKRTVEETSDLAEGILDELHSQKSTLRSAHSKVKKIDSEMSTADKILKSMRSWWR